MEIADYVKLLENCKNLILTGAPGTGKTRLAREIAKKLIGENGNEKTQIAFVQFHPSYDYTDFVEGLRPVKSDNDDCSVSGFVRQDGIFKAFCRNALQNYLDSKKTGEQLSKEERFKNAYNALCEKIIDKKIEKLELRTGENSSPLKVSTKNNICFLHDNNNSPAVSCNRLLKLFTSEQFKDIEIPTNNDIRAVIGGCYSGYDFLAILDYCQDYIKNMDDSTGNSCFFGYNSLWQCNLH